MSNHPPAVYDQASYIAWHEREQAADAPLLQKLTDLREQLMKNAPPHFKQLGQLLSQIARHSTVEAKLKTSNILSGEYSVPAEELSKKSGFGTTTFKSTSSILDKLWRKNSAGLKVTLINIQSEITDLVRLSVVAPTQLHAGIYSERLKIWKEIIPEADRKKHLGDIADVSVDTEAKLASGYFAYHAMVRFTDSFTVEIQIYSALAAAWRQLSHHLYEHARLGLSARMTPGGPSTRLVSLGHLLHLAECELERLTEELK